MIQPGAVEAAIRAAEQAGRDRRRDGEVLALKLEQARYEAERARRQYDAAEPENRLVAAELERRWNGALEAVAVVEREWVAFEAGERQMSEKIDRAALLRLADDLPGVWRDPASDMRIKKRIVRALVDPSLTDHQRPLNARGLRDAARVGEALAGLGLLPDSVYCSTAARTRQT